MKLNETDSKVLEKIIFENIQKSGSLELTDEIYACIYRDAKSVGIFSDKKFLKKVFESLLEKYENEKKG